jgi:lipoprotein-anchoring transpeptidase ErfK/SrfK
MRLAPALTHAITVPMPRLAVLSVLTPVGHSGLDLYPGPDAAAPSASLPPTDELGSPVVLLGVARQADWFEALLPTRPNGSTGWVRATEVTATAPQFEVKVSRAGHELRLVRLSDNAVLLTSPVGVGAPGTPTPAGEFFVRDLFPTGSENHPYGPFAFGLSGHSEVLMQFGTGDGRIAIHGTNQPATIGADLSAGCVHVPNDVDHELEPYLSLGTPVVID